jgi:hypothetical protein
MMGATRGVLLIESIVAAAGFLSVLLVKRSGDHV